MIWIELVILLACILVGSRLGGIGLGGMAGLVLGVGLAQLIHLVIPALPVHTPALYAVLAMSTPNA